MFQLSRFRKVVQGTSNPTFVHACDPRDILDAGFSEFCDCVYNGAASIFARGFSRFSTGRAASPPRSIGLLSRGSCRAGILAVANNVAYNRFSDGLVQSAV